MLNLLEFGMDKLIHIVIALIIIVGVPTINVLDIQQADAGALGLGLHLIDTCPPGSHWNPDLQTCDTG
jgi:hypothetical protein